MRGGKSIMAVQRKRFRIEEAFGVDMPATEVVDGDIGPMHREIMAELRAIRAQMGNAATVVNSDATATIEGSEAGLGGPTVTTQDGKTVRNLLYAFDGCFDTT